MANRGISSAAFFLLLNSCGLEVPLQFNFKLANIELSSITKQLEASIRNNQTNNVCETLLRQYFFSDNFTIPSKIDLSPLKGEDYAGDTPCPDITDVESLLMTMFHSDRSITKQFNIDSKKFSDGTNPCVKKFIDEDRINLGDESKIVFYMTQNSSNVDIPALSLFQKIDGTNVKLGATEIVKAGYTGAINTTLELDAIRALLTSIMKTNADIVLESGKIELATEIDGEHKFLLAPTGNIEISLSIPLNLDINFSEDMPCLSQL